MRTVIGYLIVSAVFVGAGLALWQTSDLEKRVAAAERDLVTLRYQEAGATPIEAPSAWAKYLPGAEASVEAATELQTTSKYWNGDYGDVAADPKAKLLAANAAYRALRKEGGNWQAVVGRMDGVVKAYADVLRDDPANAEAAFNFEYVTRLRAVVAARRQNLAPQDAKSSGNTIHGGIGEIPAEGETKQFKMIVPMRPDERQEAEKAGKGAVRQRKG